MDLEEPQQRCASQNSQYSQHRSHGKPRHHTQPRPPAPQRRPLRSVTGNAQLLRSPGPLESMLKTTTETGDIGLFSIRPALPTATYHHPPRPRPGFGDENLLFRRPSRGVNEEPVHDDRKTLPSYRDTTSEIISLYGPPTQSSFSRSFSPSMDDGQRSYSLTTCSSRRLPSQKSSCTLQSVASSGGLQRPRSPFPYPTRLKRPGVRPASPAVTENGSVDYRRMVELDRVSHRTVHGSYKPIQYTGPRRPPPLSMRPEYNRSTSSLPSRMSPGPHYQVPGPSRSRTPNSVVYGGPRSSRRQYDSSDQSVRSASLTSIVEMYQRPILPSRAGTPIRSAGAFYYDYSEDFDTGPEQELGYMVPFCPVPQRVDSFHRPMILREDGQDDLDVDNVPPVAQAKDDNQNSHDMVHAVQMGDGIKAPNGPGSDLVQVIEADVISLTAHTSLRSDHERGLHALSHVSGVPSGPDLPDPQDIDDQESTIALQGPATSSEVLSDLSWCTEWQPFKSQNRRSSEVVDPAKRDSQSSLTTHNPEPNLTLPKTPPTMNTVEGRLESKPRDENKENMVPNFPFHDRKSSLQVEDKALGVLRKSQSLPCQVQEHYGRPTKRTSPGKHKRNPANVFTGLPLVLDDAMHPELSIAKADTPILSPNPISPVQQLKLTKSIPQLMKALPPLPLEAQRQCESPFGSTSTGTEVSTGLLFTSPAKSLVPFDCEENSSFLASKIGCDKDDGEGLKAKPSKFRMRVKTSQPLNFREHSSDSSGAASAGRAEDYRGSRLKLKISRSQLKKGKLTPGPVIRSPVLKQYSSLSDLQNCPKQDLFTGRGSLDEARASKPCSGLENGGLKVTSKVAGLESPSVPSYQFDIAYPPLLVEKKIKVSRHSSHGHSLENVQKSMLYTASTGNRRGLRQKVSLLRLRVAGLPPPRPQSKRRRRCSNVSRSHERSSSPPYKTGGKALVKVGTETQQKAKTGSNRSKKRVRRVRRWAFEAKRVVRSYVRRLDRSTRSSK
ncbi:hypothetical protein B0T10DRAFT_472376 [Thelonectria olida]|uniref:Uncharacterized protein n=1 Tax=Thelonectria olida TaxID=1576542 RepID=A0A9P8WF95_9HYPO|nr:hypothetical protein B0T10DRAFT_472376 [Thelonectria olida]